MRKINKPVFLISAILLFAFTLPPKNIYSLKSKDIDGRTVNMMRFRGKKMLIITVSGQQKDSVLLHQLKAFSERYKDSVTILGVASLEDGYSEENKAKTRDFFKDKELNVILTEGAYTRKAAADKQSELMQWLTHKEQNLHFDEEVRGAGHKFFLDEAGELYAAVGPEVSLSAPFIERIMSKPIKPLPLAPALNNGQN